MAETQELIVDLRLRDNLSGSLGAAKTQLGGLETAATRVTGAIKGLVAGYIGLNVLSTITGFLRESAAAAQEEEISIARLGAALKSNVADWDGDTAAIERALQARIKLGFTDDDLRQSFTTLVAATHDVQKALDVQNVAMDLARFKGVDLATATQALTTIEAGRFRGLAQLGIQLKAGATQVEALAAVEKVAGGQAVAFGNTTAGAIDKAAASIDRLKESIGKGLDPQIGAFNRGLAQVADFFSGATQDAINQQGEALAKQAANFVRTATREQIEAARRGVAEDLKQNDSAFGPGNLFGGSDKIKAILAILDQGLQKTAEGFEETGRASLQLTKNILGLSVVATTYASDTRKLTGDIGETDIRLGTMATSARDAATYLAEADLKARNLAANLIGPLNRALVGTADSMRRFSNLDTGGDQGALDQHNFANPLPDLTIPKANLIAFASAVKDKLAGAFTAAKDVAQTLFDKLHDRHLQAIADTEKLAQTQHDAATQQINDALKLKLQQDAAPVTAAEDAQNRIELARQRRDLGANLQAAQQSGDPLAIRNAQEALESFNAAQRIAALKVTQSKLDLVAQVQATADQKTADDALAGAKLAQAKAIKTETDRESKQKADFDRQLAALQKRDAGASPAKAAADIKALQEKFGITTDPLGFHHIGDVIATAIKTIKISVPIPQFFVTVNSPPIFLNGRLIAAALSSSQSPSATPGVRQGALQPRP